MSSISSENPGFPQPPVSAVRGDIWHALIQQLVHLTVAQVDAFSARLANAFLAQSEQLHDARDANLSFNAGKLLKNNGYAFYYLASAAIEKDFRHEIQVLRLKGGVPETQQDAALSLVSYEEMDIKLALGRASRSFELAYAEELAALNMRLASLMDYDNLSTTQNPFRPEVFLKTVYSVWCEFNTDVGSHGMLLPLLRSDIMFDLGPILRGLNDILIARGILPDLQESYRVKKIKNAAESAKAAEEKALKNDAVEKLKRYFSPHEDTAAPSSDAGHQTGASHGMADYAGHTHAVNSKLFHYLADLQKNMALHQLVAGAQDVMRLSQIREQLPELASTGVEKNTLDLLSKVFDTVFHSQDIPPQIKELIGLLQVPVLKAALMDKDFFFKDTHPARRLIDLLSQYSASWDQQKGVEDPLFQTMQRNVSRVQREFDQQIDLFDEVVCELEAFMAKEEAASAEALQEPINRALQREKFKQANIAATNEVTLRISTGEVASFVETFLENRWVKVLTLAYSVKDEKPHAVADAIKTMDDLIWSVKPKITLEQRQQMVNRLPAILARLNKWLSLIKWEDADRMQFFADLAECHASIVRAPLDLTPERQLEIAVEVAQQATERRLEKRAQEEAGLASEQEPDDFVDIVANLERGVWLQFTKNDDSTHKVRLAWVSPMRSLYIFTSSQKEKSFSISTEELEKNFRDKKAQILVLDKVVDRALMAALKDDAQQDMDETVS